MSKLSFFVLVAATAFALSGAAIVPMQAVSDVWVDTDPSIGMFLRDADDGFALAQIFRSPEVRVRGVSVSHGNAPLAQGVAIARQVAAAFGADAPIFAGAPSAAALGQPTAAALALEAELERQRLVYVALGPLTNLATVLRRRPELAGRLRRVIFLGGRTPGVVTRVGPWNPYGFHDTNFERDPAAAAVVLYAGRPMTLVPIETAVQLRITRPELNRADKFLRKKAGLWLFLWKFAFSVQGGPLFDSSVVLAATHPKVLRMERRGIWLSPGRGKIPQLLAQAGETGGLAVVDWAAGFADMEKAREVAVGRLREGGAVFDSSSSKSRQPARHTGSGVSPSSCIPTAAPHSPGCRRPTRRHGVY